MERKEIIQRRINSEGHVLIKKQGASADSVTITIKPGRHFMRSARALIRAARGN